MGEGVKPPNLHPLEHAPGCTICMPCALLIYTERCASVRGFVSLVRRRGHDHNCVYNNIIILCYIIQRITGPNQWRNSNGRQGGHLHLCLILKAVELLGRLLVKQQNYNFSNFEEI